MNRNLLRLKKHNVHSEADKGSRDHNQPVCHPLARAVGVQQLQTLRGFPHKVATRRLSCLKKNMNASKPSEHVKRFSGNIG